MSRTIEQLAHDIVDAYYARAGDGRLLVGIAGPPGCGKSTIANPLTQHINSILQSPHETAQAERSTSAVCVSLDGWHYTLAELDAMEDPVYAHRWRGAAFTFNQSEYQKFLEELKTPSHPDTPATIPFSTFDHAIKNPVLSPTPITSSDRIILIEGLYTLLDIPDWKVCSDMMDFKIWVDVDEETARRRLIKRNFEAGITADLESCAERVDAVDMKNGDFVRAHTTEPTHVFVSVDGQMY
ncbi:hypothetical protein L486_03850 [Kwoniella mangroviensis CBS 10435]|uniref:Phosphoribulokinase/uridine kinase domain-containing protein n=1 Tax=Kwoniella mangroviensis CBS 10435 TaxID=1331196 RepID=A0A1B9IUY6_9TREE|nr:uncharacterized protein I203_08328 [Kwoniella mangroviensis CBS 8507]OCF59346.1 hypothetical protein L486_03850 [Kwoniella mangroviensis CBS 10435]OCF62588.1 hypothetical protein I203_08328 [Kwoniella mangroviensis CBS 8507]OCF76404.1 hypothetical protein I204_02099 [Kwoniella mangroviensis CBS 8886]